MIKKEMNRKKRHFRIRKKSVGTADRPRVSVRRTLKNLHVQIINDDDGITLFGASTTSKVVKDKLVYGGNVAAAKELAKICAQGLKDKGITKISFDRAGYLFHGRVKALAEGLREEGIQF